MSAPDINEQDIAAVVEVLRSGRLSLGPRQEMFEDEVARYVGVRHAVAVSSGTAALHLIVRALGLRPGDEVLVPSFTFAASVNCLLYEGATPVFVDIEPETCNLDPADLERKINQRTRAVVVVDAFGHPADWAAIERITAKHGLPVIDDSCEALGARYQGRPIGQFGKAAAFAFYANKQITTGEGGMIVTDDPVLAGLCRSWRNQGRGAMDAWLVHEQLGYNYRMDEMSAALGASQLQRIEELLAQRAAVAHRYDRMLGGLPWLRTPIVRPRIRMSWFVYVVLLQKGLDRDAVITSMQERGVPARSYFSPVHMQPYFRRWSENGGSSASTSQRGEGSLPVTEDISRRTIALPFHGRLREHEAEWVVEALEEAVELQL